MTPPTEKPVLDLNALEYADRLIQEFYRGKRAKAVAVAERGPLLVLITCADDTEVRVHGYWASEIKRRLDGESGKPA